MKNIALLWKKYSYSILLIFIAGGLFDLRIGLAAVICMAGPVLISLFKGRFWCGNVCPRGSFYDNIAVKFSKRRAVPKLLKGAFFRSAITIFMLVMFTMGIIKHWGDLYGMGLVIYRLIVVTTIIGIVLALFYNQRTWCSFCPMGSISALISFFRNKKNADSLLQVDNSCVSCKICKKNCPMNISPYEFKNTTLSHQDCIQCGKCADICPKKSIYYNSEDLCNDNDSYVA